MAAASFYFAKIGSVLPVNLLSFTGKKESSCNLLSWQATCTQETMFSLEKSSDGIQFTNVYTLQASMQDCNQPLSYNDCNLSQGNSFYRLKMQETNGPVMYSQQVLIKRDGVMQAVLQLLPNPVIGNTAQVRITSILSATPVITVIDMTGKKIISKKIAVNAGINSIHLDLTAVAAGMYYLVYEDGSQREVVKMMKQ